MSKKVVYRRTDEDGTVVYERASRIEYRSLREAMRTLRSLGFRPMVDDGRKLHRTWTDGRGTDAYIY